MRDIVDVVFNHWIVSLSITIAVIASFVALDLASRITAIRGRKPARYWLAGGAITMGVGIWSMHFVGMLAFSLPIPVSYDISLTLASFIAATVASAVVLDTATRPNLSALRLVAAGALMGAGIAAMHYLGMAAMRMQPAIQYDPRYVTLSVLVAIVASVSALGITFSLRHETVASTWWRKLVGALIMGAAIAGMHYLGMHAASFDVTSVSTASSWSFDNTWLAVILGTATILFLLMILAILMLETRMATIRTRLALLVIACLLPAALLTTATVSYQYEYEGHHLISDTIATARSISFAVDSDIASVTSSLQVLATASSLDSRDFRALHDQATLVLGYLNDINNISMTDAAGQQLVNTLRPLGTPLPVTGNVGLVRQVIETRRPVVSGLFTGALAKKPLIAVAVPVFNDGDVKYVLGASMLPERLASLLHQQQLPPEWIVTIFDKNGAIVARTHEINRFLGMPGASDLIRKMALRQEGAVEGTSKEGIPVVAVFTRSPRSGLSVAIAIPKSSLNRNLQYSIWLTAAGTVLILIFSLAVAMLLGRRIGESIRALMDPAQALSRGEKIVAPEVHLHEVNEVGRALQKTAEILFQAQYAAHHDALTGLINRTLLKEIAKQQLEVCIRERKSLAILYIDLDGFKNVNDTLGHAAGDRVLTIVAERIRAEIRQSDVAARLGGDEFAVVLNNPDKEGAETVARKLIDSLSLPIQADAFVARISASIGIALYPSNGTRVNQLLHRADKAMYKAKTAGKRCYAFAEDNAQ